MGTAAEDESAPMSLFMENAFSIQTYQTCQDSQWKSTHILVEHTHECTIMCMYMCVSRGAAERPAPASTRVVHRLLPVLYFTSLPAGPFRDEVARFSLRTLA